MSCCPEYVGRGVRRRRSPGFVAVLVAALIGCPNADAQMTVVGARLQERASALLGIMGFGLTPDVTTGSLGISDTTSGDPRIQTTSLGGGFTWSDDLPLYLEGTAAYSRYDPRFVVTDGTDTRTVPTRWNSMSVTVGIGWDIPVAPHLKLRPMLNATYGYVTSDAAVGTYLIEDSIPNADLDFLHAGQMNALGLGGSLMLDYERFRPEGDIDVELRYTSIQLKSRGNSSLAVEGSSLANSLNLWARWRAPTGEVLLERPLRYVLEYGHTSFYGDLDGALGFDRLNSIGAGLELDTGRFDSIVTRVRLLLRYKFGASVRGTSIGLAASF